MNFDPNLPHRIEPLEARIAPAALLPVDSNKFVKATIGAPIELHEGEILTTTGVPNSGAYLLFVEKGNALVFTTDLNNNKVVDFNEITGIAAGDGLRLISFVDIHGDIVTNLIEKTITFPGPNGPVTDFGLFLSDSDSNPANDSKLLDGDGRVLLNKTIEKIELRSLTVDDIPDQNGDGTIDDVDIGLRKAESTYSIFGSIYAGAGFGVAGDDTSGLLIDATGLQNFGFEASTRITVGAIRVGTAASNQFFSFGASRLDDISGTLVKFVPARGVAGGDIHWVRSANNDVIFNIDGLYAGDGGIGARGGDIRNVTFFADDTSGYELIAGNGGRGPSGGDGGSILDFSDLGSDTGRVRIVTGSGGAGATGFGGNAGNLSYETFNVIGNISIALGNGGNGFSGGGNGASLASGIFTEPANADMVPRSIVGTTHFPSGLLAGGTVGYTPRIGNHAAVDFDLDGFGDMVFTTTNASQLVVVFGDPLQIDGQRRRIGPDGLPEIDRIYLPAPHNAEALVVGDLNADGLMDIAAASFDEGNHGGVFVYLNQFEDADGDGFLGSDEDLNDNNRNDFLGFRHPILSTLPTMERGDSDTLNAFLPFWESPNQISDLAIGDFNGDGRAEVAVVATYYGLKADDPTTGATIALAFPTQTVFIMEPDLEVNNLTGRLEYTGQFYADFGTKREEFVDANGNPVVIPPAPLAPYFPVREDIIDPNGNFVQIEATPLRGVNAAAGASTYDSLIVSARSSDVGIGLLTLEFADRVTQPSPLLPGITLTGFWEQGRVDTNRGPDVDLAFFATRHFTATDYDGDDLTDLIAVSSAPEAFLVGIHGNGDGTGFQSSGGSAVYQPSPNNAGHFFPSYNLPAGLLIRSTDLTGDLIFDEYAVVGGDALTLFQFAEGPGQASALLLGVGNSMSAVTFEDVALDFFYAATDSSIPLGPVAGDVIPPAGYPEDSLLLINLLFLTDVPIETIERSLFLSAGDGGDSLIGSGGLGGFLGSGGDTDTVIDPLTGQQVLDYVGTLEFVKTGVLRLLSGAGGDGFARGGNGGDITGVSSRVPFASLTASLSVALTSGDGGRGVTGRGGDGGSITENSLFGGYIYRAGDGGLGVFGGNGGSVIGNRTGVFDTTLSFAQTPTILTIEAGHGASGTKRGGSGGNIFDMLPIFTLGTDEGDLAYVAGNGGDSVAGRGGDGGSVRRSSPAQNAFMEGDIYLKGGDGGDGRIGGNGGGLSEFTISLAAQSKSASVVAFIAGNGGFGTKSNGGTGGSVDQIDVSSRGIRRLGINALVDLETGALLNNHEFNRIIAGAGGGSAKTKGGAGGGVTNVSTSADQNGYAIVGGAGGDGLKKGGPGGNLDNLDVFFGASTTAKGLFVAGEGGDATAFVVNPNDSTPNQGQIAFGGKVGRGGQGGNINSVVQRGNIGVHLDLIAGNGGDTVNYGTVADGKFFVGNGGSVSNVNTAGDIGNIAFGVAIHSYNDLLAGETVAEYVTAKFRDPLAPLGGFLTDADGNVGIIVGAAGRNKAVVFDPAGNPFVYETQPASGAKNGSLINLTTRNLMAAVAGSVDRIASIQSTVALKVLAGEIGSDKGTSGVADFLDKNGVPTATGSPVRDGRLVDGAVVTREYLDANLDPLPPPPGVILL